MSSSLALGLRDRHERRAHIGYDRVGFPWLLNVPSLLAIFVLAA